MSPPSKAFQRRPVTSLSGRLGQSVFVEAAHGGPAAGIAVQVTAHRHASTPWTATRVMGATYVTVAVADPSAAHTVAVVPDTGVYPVVTGVLPAALGTTAERLIFLRPAPVALQASADVYESAATPVAGVTRITVGVKTARRVADVRVVEAVVNGVAAEVTARGSRGEFGVTYVTESGDEEWPWRGLHVDMAVVDSGGLTSFFLTGTR